jgi:hypothetical protein
VVVWISLTFYSRKVITQSQYETEFSWGRLPGFLMVFGAERDNSINLPNILKKPV